MPRTLGCVSGAEFCDEADLVQGALRRDAAAFRRIMRQHNTRLYRIARSILRDDCAAEDVVQETYLKAFSQLGSFRGESSLGTWLARIVINHALGSRRQRRHEANWTTLDDNESGSDVMKALSLNPHQNPERVMAQQEIQRMLEAGIDGLPEKYRVVLVMRLIEGMSVEQTADLLAIGPEAVKVRLHRARALLRAELERQIGPLMLGTFPFAGARCDRLTEAVLRRLDLA
jgi:RNA polymerase sigma-70 factor (ECF subfamily)